ncbi:MAG TPA: amidohydrolase family protein, partial [Planctomycetota bacterium]|nr:amidohydrolase family protein [Planctomycetota bacterium]
QRDGARARLAQSLALIDRLGGGSRCFGLSPHAPYSVNAEVLPEIARAARWRGLRLAMHLAETVDETRYLLHGDGPFVDFLRTIGRGAPFSAPPRMRPIALAEQAGLLAAGCVVIHGNDLDDDDVARLAAHRSSVVYCHGTHGHFARPLHRLPELLAAGVNVALGTDSGLSNLRVDLLDELRRLHADRPELDPLALLRCATWGGRVALQHEPAAALLQPGSPADALLLSAPPDAERCSAQELAHWALSHAAQPLLTFHAGSAAGPCDGLPPPLTAFLDTTLGHR